jgi:signal transduction histidine kinase
LFNNAFYAVRERQKQMDSTYQPEVTVSSAETKYGIEIRIRDNGTGIPESVQQKIFQPFFTTKPTGEGTGLGLSLSYDIVTKGHNGSLEVTSQAGVGTTFVISLPMAKTGAFSIE